MMNKQIGIIGLGKMGGGIALNLKDKGWEVFGYNRTPEVTEEFQRQGIKGSYSFAELKSNLKAPRIFWVTVTAGEATNSIITELQNIAEPGDYIIDAGNSFYKNSKTFGQKLELSGINFLDVGVSGGPSGAKNGACLMIGGRTESFKNIENLFSDISKDGVAYKFFEGYGAGHFVKMVHNGIEYGMMQSIAEGFNLMKDSEYYLNLTDVAEIYQNGSVIESRLVGWLKEGFEKYGQELVEIIGSVASTGEGQWTVDTAEEKNIKVDVIKKSLEFRKDSEKNPSYTGKLLSLLRNMFGGHAIK